MKGFVFAAMVVAMGLSLNSTVEAARWKIKSPKNGRTFDIGANISVNGKGRRGQFGTVVTGDNAFGTINVANARDVIAKKGKWATVFPPDSFFDTTEDLQDFVDPLAENVIVVAGDLRSGGQEFDFVVVNIVD
ncbi:MAG: hypothetical protein FJ267_07915 [Planctomycetes bacterium]|nr:hypothetical protein [Planctomycetota bacterium]